MDASDYIKRARQRMVTADVLGKRTQFNEGHRAWFNIQGTSGNYESTYQEIAQGTVELTPAEYTEIVQDATVGEITITDPFEVRYDANTSLLTITIPEISDPSFDDYNFYFVGPFEESQWAIMQTMTRTGSILSLTCTYHSEISGKLFAYLTTSSDTTSPPWSGNPDVVLYGGFSSGATNNYAVYHSVHPTTFNFDYYKNNPVDNTGIQLDRDLYGYVTDGIVERNVNEGLTLVSPVIRNISNKMVLQYTNPSMNVKNNGSIVDLNYNAVSADNIIFNNDTSGTHIILDDATLNAHIGGGYRIINISEKDTTHYVYYYTEFTVPPLNP